MIMAGMITAVDSCTPVNHCRVKDLGMTDDLLREDKRQLLLFSVSSDGDLRCWAFNPENVSRSLFV